MTHLKEAEPCSQGEAKVRRFHHCHDFGVPERQKPPSQSEQTLNFQACSDCGFCRAVRTHTCQQLKSTPGFLSSRAGHTWTYSLFKPLLWFVQVQTWSRSLVYTLEELECKICYNGYDSHSRKPKLLGCLHRVCAQCLKKMVTTGECTWLGITVKSSSVFWFVRSFWRLIRTDSGVFSGSKVTERLWVFFNEVINAKH